MRTLLKRLVDARYLRDVTLFNRAYDQAAAEIDRGLVGSGPSQEQLLRWLSGRVKTAPRPHHCMVLERMFPGHSVAELLGPADPPERAARSGGVDPAPDRRGWWEEDATNRREFVVGGTAAAGLVLAALLDEPDRMNATLDSGAVRAERPTAPEETANQLGVWVTKEAPGPLAGETLAAFRTVRGLIDLRQRTTDRIRLVRTGSKLALVLGEILFNEGEVRQAGRWYATARDAALDVGDQHLADFALGGSCYGPTYFGDPGEVLGLVDARLDGRPTPTPGVAWLWGFKAKAHAARGEEVAFRHAINRSREVLDAAPADLDQPGIFGFRPGKLAFYEATGCVRLRDANGAIRAADLALRLGDPRSTTNPALARLDKASAFTQAGDVPEACRIATGAVLDKGTYPSSSVVRRAREFDHLLGQDSTAPVREWREALHSVTSRRPALTT